MFEFDRKQPEVIDVNGSSVYIIDDFYKDIDSVESLISGYKAHYHKGDKEGYNGILFHDMRHNFYHESVAKVGDYLKELCGSSRLLSESRVLTNIFKYEGSDHEDNCWYPHIDPGYTAIIYFYGSGTNLYTCNNQFELSRIDNIPEHLEPWRSKNDWECLLTVEGKRNRMMLFNGSLFYHGADIKDSPCQRMNQVLFFN